MAVTTTDEIRQKVMERLEEDSRIEAATIQVEIEEHRVLLRGSAPSFAALVAAEEDARGAEGVQSVENQLHIELSAERQRPDEEIRATIGTALELVLLPQAPSSDIELIVAEGVVRLRGAVPTLWIKRRAFELAILARGVRQVHNELRVSPSERVEDEELSRRLRLMAERFRSKTPGALEISVRQGAVFLSGTVENNQSLVEIEEGLSRVSGVRSLQSRLYIP
jgi:osmotically-inducible protein OsmY